jgi:S-adenosyl methyltransferase
MLPIIVTQARADRAFLGRAIHYLAGAEGVRQFLDIGTGLPTADNTHEVAQRVAPESRIVYVDNDPLVLVHARALLASTPQGSCDYVDGDVHDPERILADAARTLDLAQPVALMLLGILHHVPDLDEAYSIVNKPLPPCNGGKTITRNSAPDSGSPINTRSGDAPGLLPILEPGEIEQ